MSWCMYHDEQMITCNMTWCDVCSGSPVTPLHIASDSVCGGVQEIYYILPLYMMYMPWSVYLLNNMMYMMYDMMYVSSAHVSSAGSTYTSSSPCIHYILLLHGVHDVCTAHDMCIYSDIMYVSSHHVYTQTSCMYHHTMYILRHHVCILTMYILSRWYITYIHDMLLIYIHTTWYTYTWSAAYIHTYIPHDIHTYHMTSPVYTSSSPVYIKRLLWVGRGWCVWVVGVCRGEGVPLF